MPSRKLVEGVTRQYANRVRECRLRALVPRQRDLSRMTGIGPDVISALENGRVWLSAHYALLISEALGCRLDDLYVKRDALDPAPETRA